MNILIMDYERIISKQARNNYITLSQFGTEHIARDAVSLQTIQQADFFFVTDKHQFRILKNRSPGVPEQGVVLPLSYLPKTVELVMEYYQPRKLTDDD